MFCDWKLSHKKETRDFDECEDFATFSNYMPLRRVDSNGGGQEKDNTKF